MAKQTEEKIKPSVSEGLKAIATWYFEVHAKNLEEAGIDKILVADDGEVFYGTPKGANYCQNHCSAKGIKFKEFENISGKI
jgi:hypothetical protein